MKNILIIIFSLLFTLSCSDNGDKGTSSADANQKFDLLTAEGLCLYVMNEAEKETGDNKPPAAVIFGYRETVCPQATQKDIALWQCYKDQIDSGKGFYEADEQCANQ